MTDTGVKKLVVENVVGDQESEGLLDHDDLGPGDFGENFPPDKNAAQLYELLD